jgi:peptidoglycan hydrolase-like protein with peptidoglycan-binding domain
MREEAPAPTAAPARRDPIAALLGGEPANVTPPAARVMAVQKALIKSGFVLKADGQWGASTREALAGFERERKLPVTGDLSARTLKELSARTGISIP